MTSSISLLRGGRALVVQAVLGLWLPILGLWLLRMSFMDRAPLALLFPLGLALFVVGGWAAYQSWTALQLPTSESRDLPPRTVDEPWTHRQDWRLPLFTKHPEPVNTYYLIGAVFWTFIGWPLVLSEWRSTASSGSFGGEDVFMLFIPISGAACLVKAIWPRIQMAQFGRPRLRLDTLPAWMGGSLQGAFHVERTPTVLANTPIDVRFSCYHRYLTTVEDRDGDRRTRVVKDVKWYADDTVTPQPSGDALEVPVAFDVPTGLPEATPREEDDRIVWEVRAKASVPGVDYRTAFEVPVFDPTRHDAAPDDLVALRDDASVSSDQAAPATTVDDPSEVARETEGIELTRLPGDRITVSFDRWRTQGGVRFAFLGGAAVSFLAVGGVLAYAGAGIAGAVLGVIGLASTGGFARLWNSRSLLEVGPDKIRIANDLTGSQRDRRFDTNQLSDVRIDETGNVGSNKIYGLTLCFAEADTLQALKEEHGVDGPVPYVLYTERTSKGDLDVAEHLDLAEAVATASKKLPVAQGLKDKAEAQWLADEILQAGRFTPH